MKDWNREFNLAFKHRLLSYLIGRMYFKHLNFIYECKFKGVSKVERVVAPNIWTITAFILKIWVYNVSDSMAYGPE